MLNDFFQKNNKPTTEEMQDIANKINVDSTTIKVWFCNKKQTMKRLGHPSVYRNDPSSPKMMKQEILMKQDIVPDKQVVKMRKSEPSPQHQQGIFQLNTAGSMKTIIPASTQTGTVTMPFFISQDGNPIPIVSGATISSNTNNQVVQPSTTLGQQIVHLSQVPIHLTSMVVNNGGLQQQGNTNNTDNNPNAAQLISGGRIISPGSVLHLPGGALQAQQQAIQQAQLNQTQSTLNNQHAAVMMAAANAVSSSPISSMQQQVANTAALVNASGVAISSALTRSSNGNNLTMLSKTHGNSIKETLKMSEKDLEADEVCVSDDSNKSNKLPTARNNP